MRPSAKSKTKLEPSVTSWEFEAIGTHWWVGLFEHTSADRLIALQRKVAERIERFDKTYSRFRDDSLVSRIATQAGVYAFPEDGRMLIELYKRLYDATDGAVTPLIGDLLVAAGYDAHYSLQAKEMRAPRAWDEVLTYADGVLTVRQPVVLDFGAAGKGYLVDIVANLLMDEGVHDFCIDAGGDLYVRGGNTIHVGLEHPDDVSKIVGVAELDNQAVAGSSPNRRAWKDYHHIMDPHVLRSTVGLKASWVVADSGLLADGLATALFFVPPDKLKQFDFEYLLINDDNQYKQSVNFPAELF